MTKDKNDKILEVDNFNVYISYIMEVTRVITDKNKSDNIYWRKVTKETML